MRGFVTSAEASGHRIPSGHTRGTVCIRPLLQDEILDILKIIPVDLPEASRLIKFES